MGKVHSLLERLLKKRGVAEVKDLDNAERAWFDEKERILSGGELTVERVADFCRRELALIDHELHTNPDLSEKKDTYLKAGGHILSKLLGLIEGKDRERAEIEKEIRELLDKAE